MFPSLKAFLQLDNFDIIVETVQKRFGYLIDLSLLDQEIEQKRTNGSYVVFCTTLLSKLGKLYTPAEISYRVNDLLNSDGYSRVLMLSSEPSQQNPLSFDTIGLLQKDGNLTAYWFHNGQITSKSFKVESDEDIREHVRNNSYKLNNNH